MNIFLLFKLQNPTSSEPVNAILMRSEILVSNQLHILTLVVLNAFIMIMCSKENNRMASNSAILIL